MRRSLAIVLSVAVACGGTDAVVPPTPSTPASVQAVSGQTAFGGVVGSAVTVAVVVRDAGESPVSGATVAFAVIHGLDATPLQSVSTDAQGRAAVSWPLSTVAGYNELLATVTGLTPVKFTAMGVAGPPAALVKLSGDGQTGDAGIALDQPLSVRVNDAYGNGVPSVAVSFAVSSGGGTLSGSPATTSSGGVAAGVLWTLGSGSTDQTVSASVASMTATFTGHLDACPAVAIDVGASVSGTLATGDCVLAGTLADRYALTTASPGAVAVSFTSSAFDPRLLVSRSSAVQVASTEQLGTGGITYCAYSAPPDGCHSATVSTRSSPVVVLTAPGKRYLTATSTSTNASGAYTLSVAAASGAIAGCATVFVERGVTTSQQLESTDCHVRYGTADLYYTDDVKLYLAAGSQLSVTLSASAFTPWLEIYSPTGAYQAACAGPGSTTCTLTAPVSGFYLISASSYEEHGVGAYVLTIN